MLADRKKAEALKTLKDSHNYLLVCDCGKHSLLAGEGTGADMMVNLSTLIASLKSDGFPESIILNAVSVGFARSAEV